ncbi:MAG: ATP-dependent sacrificial sulfur transferase LarE [Actinobacteria bacterium]|nr:MAG: ATP-dependent sacrificial sulfur transferase LarE [Actinomycetota bacterium]
MSSLGDLEAAVARAPSAVVAFSGGVDSSLVAAVAARVLNTRALAVTAVSPALAAGELDAARAVADAVGIAHRTITTDELAREGYRRNGPDRCYHCKTELYERLAALASSEGFAVLYSGANVDDLGDWRPGLRAAAEHGVRHPLVEAGFTKADVRRVANDLQVPSADKPAMPCLASRVPYGTEVDPAVLARIDRAEHAVRTLGYREIRVRHLGATSVIELGDDDLARARHAPESMAAIEDAVRAAGFIDARLADSPLRSGSFNRRQLPVMRRSNART